MLVTDENRAPEGHTRRGNPKGWISPVRPPEKKIIERLQNENRQLADEMKELRELVMQMVKQAE